ncbi:hypothetical protein NE865_09855 [Phthorimaea operculella]|nr:hypothetical protein NE865_09855 [Phthorimaea operculella]
MDNTALLAKSVKDLAAWMDSRMAEFEKNSQLAGSPGTPKVKDLTTEYLSFKSTVLDTLAMLRAQLELVVNGLDRLETHSRRKVLLFHGVPEAESEDLPKKIDTILRDQLKMTSPGSAVIEVCHRLGAKRDKNRPVLVRFTTATHRSAVWNAKTKLKGSKMRSGARLVVQSLESKAVPIIMMMLTCNDDGGQWWDGVPHYAPPSILKTLGNSCELDRWW